MQDIPAIARRACARPDRADGQHLGDAAVLPPHAAASIIAIEAGTKYCSGSSDLLLGMVSANERCWRDLRATFDTMAICAGPEDVFLALRGLRTMKVRLLHHQQSALAVAKWFAARPRSRACCIRRSRPIRSRDLEARFHRRVRAVQHRAQADAGQAAHAFINALTLFGIGASWGGFESLAIPFDCAAVPHRDQMESGRPAIRFHIGLEDVGDLTADLERGFRRDASGGGA
jgi:cystathionine beta-lyase